MPEFDNLSESPILSAKAGRELQIIWLEVAHWLQYVMLGPDEVTELASSSFYKSSIWGRIKQSQKWLSSLIPKPVPTKKPETEKEFSDWAFDFLSNKWNSVYKKLAAKTTFLGYLSGFLTGNLNLPPSRVYDMGLFDFDLALREKEGKGLNRMEAIARQHGSSVEQVYALAYAQRHGSEWVAIYDDAGERSGRAYEACMNLFRKQLEQSIESGEPVSALRSRFAFPNILELLERGDITEEEYIEWSFKHLNRDMLRFALTETSFAFNNGKLAYLVDRETKTGRPSYVKFVKAMA